MPEGPPASRGRLAFVGQTTYFKACALEGDANGWETTFIEFRAGADADLLVARLRDFGPDVTVVFRPEIVPHGVLAEVDTRTLGFLTEPLPRTSVDGAPAHEDLERRLDELQQVDAASFDRVVSFDPHIARTADRVLAVWRSLPLPVADRFYAPVPAGPLRPQPLFVGHASPYRERVLIGSKHRHDILHIAFGADSSLLERFMREHDVAINVHNNPYPSFENRVCLHLAAGHLVLSERLHPLHGLEPGIDFVVFDGGDELAELLAGLRANPVLWRGVRLRGRRKAELFRASRVWPRILGDFLADLHATRRAA